MAILTTALATAAILKVAEKAGEKAAEKAGERFVEGAEGGAKALFGKIKGLLGLKSNANSPELKKEVETALAAKPEAVAELQKMVPPAYWQNAGTVNQYVEKGQAVGQQTGDNHFTIS